jgi:hypothetical protein
MAAKLSALQVGLSLPLRNIPRTHLCQRLSRPEGHSAAGRIRSIEKSNDLIGIEPATFQLVAECLNQLRYRELPRKYKRRK